MEPTTDMFQTLVTTGGGGLGGAAITAYILTKLHKDNSSPDQMVVNEMRSVASKLDQTNELLNELLRSHARLEGLLQHKQNN